jgi:hypothetical protein
MTHPVPSERGGKQMSTANRQRVSIAARPGSPLGWPGELRGPRGNAKLAKRFVGCRCASERGGEQ